MYATSADWSFDSMPDRFRIKTPYGFQSTSNDFPAEIKSMGALSFFLCSNKRDDSPKYDCLAR